jgi:hypothetical protein
VTVRLVCSGWKCRHDALVMRLRQDATDEGAGVLCGAAVARGTSSATALRIDGRWYASSEQPYCAHLPRPLDAPR